MLQKIKHYSFALVHNYAIPYLYVQMACTAISLPLLAATNKPLSMLTFAGNIIAGPFLIASLLCCAILFFGELFYLPIDWCCPLLDLITSIWSKVLHTAGPWALFTLNNTYYYRVMALAPCAALWFLQKSALPTWQKLMIITGITVAELCIHFMP